LAAARFHVQHVAQQVLLPETVRPLGLRAVEQALLCLGAAQFQVVQRVLVGFEADHLHDPRAALGLLSGGEPLGLTVLPLGGVRDLLLARKENCVEMLSLFNKDVFSVSSIFAVQAAYCVTSGSGTRKEVKRAASRGHARPNEVLI